jgi:hypothetical protein
MNRIVEIAKAAFPFTIDGRILRHAPRGVFALMSTLCLLLVSTGAHAACGRFGALNGKSPVRLPMIAQADPAISILIIGVNPPIVGLWHVIYTNGADESVFNDTFDTWHSDRTEFESAFLAPLGGNLCVGVWKQTGLRSVALHHVGWLFDPSNPNGTATNTFTLDEAVSVAPDGATYSGSFTFKVWNLDGSPTPVEVRGTIAATRITVN